MVSVAVFGTDAVTIQDWTDATNAANLASVKKYTVSYAYSGEVPENAPELTSSKLYKYGTEVTVAGAPTFDGYTFSGWDKDDFRMRLLLNKLL